VQEAYRRYAADLSRERHRAWRSVRL